MLPGILRFFGLLLIILSIPELTLAHNAASGSGFEAGLTHPVLGFDHFLAMVSVGILSMQMGGRAVWLLPITFVSVMAVGAGIALWLIPVGVVLIILMLGVDPSSLADPQISGTTVELGIALSVVFLGGAIFFQKKCEASVSLIFVALFALCHGYAHGREMPEISSPYGYAAGFMIGTACLHILGVMIGYVGEKIRYGREILRYTGLTIAAIGLYILQDILIS